MKAWIYNESNVKDIKEKNQFPINKQVTHQKLAKLGVLYWKVDNMDQVDKICQERNYKNRDVVCISRDTLPNYDEKLKTFFTEHLHEDEEIRYMMEGSGYFDVRSDGDEWIRIAVNKDDLIVLPAGIYHRFTLDTNEYAKAMRLFKEEPKWTAINRTEESEQNPYRQSYLKFLSSAV